MSAELITAGIAVATSVVATAISPMLRTLLAAIFRKPRASSVVVRIADREISVDLPAHWAESEAENIRQLAVKKALDAGSSTDVAQQLARAVVAALLKTPRATSSTGAVAQSMSEDPK